MHKKYADKGLVVLAVNGWNEPKADVAWYVRNNRLSHRVLLRGAEVAERRYGVRQYPTKFWINREGIIVHQLAGFSGHDVKMMEKWIEEIL